MKYLLLLIAFTMPLLAEPDWRLALPGWQYRFPEDHQPHREFKTEWWYFTGNLKTADGAEFGYQLTFFRQGVRRERPEGGSRFIVDDIKFAHFALSDFGAEKFRFFQKMSRGAFGEAGFGPPPRLAWIEGWELRLEEDGAFRLEAKSGDASIALRLESSKPPILNGQNGVSQKAAGLGQASHYYSLTRLRTSGSISAGGKTVTVTGDSWFDHEWASNQLAPNQVGWDWFSLQLADGSELMLYQMRLDGGGVDPTSSGTYIDPQGGSTHLLREDYRLAPLDYWRSPTSKARYPVRWRLEVPKLGIQMTISARFPSQELALGDLAYWEGGIQFQGQRNGSPVRGVGYMELTGYGNPLPGIRSREEGSRPKP